MEEMLILLGAIVLAFVTAMVKSMQLAPSMESEFELERKADDGDDHARHELNRRMVLPLLVSLQRVKVALLVVGLVGLLVATHEVWVGLLLSLAFLLIVELVAARGWLVRMVWRLQQRIEPLLMKFVYQASFVFNLWAPRTAGAHGGPVVASRAELKKMIEQDQTVLSGPEKARLLGALDFAHTTIHQAMVPREQVVTVDIDETVGPLLMDRLHKAGHNIFPVVKKDLGRIKGLLYMADLVPLHPDLKDMQDALRPTVHYLPANAHIAAVLSASLQTGRQLFLVTNDAGEVEGLITLADALRHLLGQPLGKDAPVTTKAK